jgi:hypothetical protein
MYFLLVRDAAVWLSSERQTYHRCSKCCIPPRLKKKMIEAGMAYLRFAVHHSDYFAVIFQAGLEKAKYPELEHSARQAFATILDLSAQYERTPELGLERAVVAWALVHGLARLELEGGIAMAVKRQPGLEHLRPLLERFLSTPS